VDGYGGFERFLSLGLLMNYFTLAKGVVLDMLELTIKSIFAIYIIRLVLKHNLFIHYLKISIKFIGLDIEIKSKQKDAPSSQD
jgi:hypothetical protein